MDPVDLSSSYQELFIHRNFNNVMYTDDGKWNYLIILKDEKETYTKVISDHFFRQIFSALGLPELSSTWMLVGDQRRVYPFVNQTNYEIEL